VSENPYAAPLASVSDPVKAAAVPEEVRKQIKYAWVAASISGLFTLTFALLAISGTSLFGYSAWELVDAALVFGLAFGIYKKSRICAVVTFAYFIGSKIYMMVEAGQPNGIVLGMVFAFFYYQGVMGTFAYHKIVRSRAAQLQGRV
jgi:serine/threonine-protein kinase